MYARELTVLECRPKPELGKRVFGAELPIVGTFLAGTNDRDAHVLKV